MCLMDVCSQCRLRMRIPFLWREAVCENPHTWCCFETLTTFFFIHSSVGGHCGCFHSLVIVNHAAKNTGVQTSLCNSDLDQKQDCWIIYNRFICKCLRNRPTVFEAAAPFYIPTHHMQAFQFLHPHPCQHVLSIVEHSSALKKIRDSCHMQQHG